MQTLNTKSEADRRKTYKEWHVRFMDKNHLAAAGFYFTNCSDLLWSGSRLLGGRRQRDRRPSRWSPSCGFIKGLFVGNIPIHSETSSPFQQTSRSLDVCGPLIELRPNSRPEQSKYNHLYLGFICMCLY